MSLAQIAQDDFAVGTLLGLAPDVQPGVGVEQAINGLINDDGDIYVRGATARLSTNSIGVPLSWVWSGKLGDSEYVLAATTAAMYQLDGANTLNPIVGAAGLQPGARGCVIGSSLYLPNRVKLTGAAGVISVGTWEIPAALTAPYFFHVATITGRLIIANGDTIAFSSATDPAAFAATDYHRLPGGVSTRGLYAMQDTLMTFTNYGLWTVTNMAYDLTDADGNVQQTLSQIVPDLSLLGEGGLTPYQGRVVAACVDGVYLVDPVNTPTKVSDSIAALYTDLTKDLFTPGGAKVYHDTLFLPMISPPLVIPGEGTVTTWVMLTCRLNRPARARYVYYPWTAFDGHAQQQQMLDFWVTDEAGPRLISAGVDGYINDLTEVLGGVCGLDGDGAAPELTIETRDFPTGQGQPNHLKRVRLSYSAQTASDVDLALAYSVDTFHQTWTDLPAQPLVNPGDDPIACWVAPVKRARYARVRIKLAHPDLITFVLHRVELQARSAAHAR